MDLNFLLEELSEEEKKVYMTKSCNDYYYYFLNTDFFKEIQKKLSNHANITEDEWEEILKKLYLLTCKAVSEEDSLDLLDRFIYLFARVGFRFSQEDTFFYNECYKMIAYIVSIKRTKELNIDLFNGLDYVMDHCEETELDLLLRQHQEASIFRNYKDRFLQAYQDSQEGVISSSERISINTCERAFQREKELVLQYPSML